MSKATLWRTYKIIKILQVDLRWYFFESALNHNAWVVPCYRSTLVI